MLTLESIPARFWTKVVKTPDCWLWTGARAGNALKYGNFKWNGKVVTAHRWLYEQLHGPIAPGMCCCHRCDNPLCVRPDHIFLGTRAENGRDCWRKGRNVFQTNPELWKRVRLKPGHKLTNNGGGFTSERTSGERNPRSRLTANQVALIRRLVIDLGAEPKPIALYFNITLGHLKRIVAGSRWAVPMEA